MFRPRRNVAGSFAAFEQRRRSAEARYHVALPFWEHEGWIEEGLLYDAKHDVFRFADDSAFALSREYANWSELERRGFEP